MRIKLTPAQLSILEDHLSVWIKSGDIALGATYADIDVQDIPDVRDAVESSPARGQAAARLWQRLHDSIPAGFVPVSDDGDPDPDDDAVNGPEVNAEPLTEPAPSQDTPEPAEPVQDASGPEEDGAGDDTPALPTDATEPATPADGDSDSDKDDDPLSLPNYTRDVLTMIREGEYGEEPQRLALGMDTRTGERPTRFVGRLRHKLTSAGYVTAATDLHLTPLRELSING